MIVTRSHKYRHHCFFCCDIGTFRRTCRSKTVEFEHRHYRPIKARLSLFELLFELLFFFETDLNGKVLPLLVTIGQHLLQHTRRNVSKHLVHRWTLRSVAFIETALSAILQASFIGILLCRRHFPSHSRELTMYLATLDESSIVENGRGK